MARTGGGVTQRNRRVRRNAAHLGGHLQASPNPHTAAHANSDPDSNPRPCIASKHDSVRTPRSIADIADESSLGDIRNFDPIHQRHIRHPCTAHSECGSQRIAKSNTASNASSQSLGFAESGSDSNSRLQTTKIGQQRGAEQSVAYYTQRA